VGVVDGLDGESDPGPTVLLCTVVGRAVEGHSGSQSHHRLPAMQPVMEVALVRPPVRGQIEVVGPEKLLVDRRELEDLVDAVGTGAGARDDVPAARLEDEAVRLQAAFHVGGLTPAAVQDVQDAAVPDRVGHRREVRRLVGVGVPAGCVEVEAAADPVGVAAQLRWQGGADLELSCGQDGAEAELGGGAGDTGEEEGLGLVGGESGEAGAVAVEEAVATGVARVAVERDAGRAQRLDVPVHRADRHLQFVGELGGGHPAAGLEQQKDGDESAGLH
jgi:hypothetical protein